MTLVENEGRSTTPAGHRIGGGGVGWANLARIAEISNIVFQQPPHGFNVPSTSDIDKARNGRALFPSHGNGGVQQARAAGGRPVFSCTSWTRH